MTVFVTYFVEFVAVKLVGLVWLVASGLPQLKSLAFVSARSAPVGHPGSARGTRTGQERPGRSCGGRRVGVGVGWNSVSQSASE